MSHSTDSTSKTQTIRKSKIKLGRPPAPRAYGEWIVFTHLPRRVRLELVARGWKFVQIRSESIELGGAE